MIIFIFGVDLVFAVGTVAQLEREIKPNSLLISHPSHLCLPLPLSVVPAVWIL